MLRFLCATLAILAGLGHAEKEDGHRIQAEESTGAANDMVLLVKFDETKPPLEEQRDRRSLFAHDCFVNGRWIAHGTESTVTDSNPCYTMLCWNGVLQDQKDGCPYQGNCYPINAVFDFTCATFECTKTQETPTVFKYVIHSIDRKCMDGSGNCRAPGERNFPAYISDTYYNSCTCQPGGRTHCVVTYWQGGPYGPRPAPGPLPGPGPFLE